MNDDAVKSDGEKAQKWVNRHLELDRELIGKKPSPSDMAMMMFIYGLSLSEGQLLEFRERLLHWLQNG